jgi:Ulp1 family protease
MPCQAGKLFGPQDLQPKNMHGFVINTGQIDYGVHWVSLFVDLTRGKVEYFDPMGHGPGSERVRQTVNSIRAAVKKAFAWADIGKKVQFVSTRKQYGGVECGMFALMFMASRISGKSLLDISQMSIDDDDCTRLRDYFFHRRHMDISEFQVTDHEQPPIRKDA